MVGSSKPSPNRAVARIGVVSFSVYLWHFAVVTALRPLTLSWPGLHGATFAALYLCVVAIAVALSEVSYRMVERPMIETGRALARRVGRSPAARAPEAATASAAFSAEPQLARAPFATPDQADKPR